MNVLRFPQADGTEFVLTQDPKDPTRWTNSMEGGRTVSSEIVRQFDAGAMTKKY